MINFNPMNPAERQTYLQDLVERLKGPKADLTAVLAAVERRVESLSSMAFPVEDKRALRLYLRRLTAGLRRRDIDDSTAQLGINRIVMAAAANSPDLASYIRAEV